MSPLHDLSLAIVDEIELAVGLARAVQTLEYFGISAVTAQDTLNTHLEALRNDAARLHDRLCAEGRVAS